MCTNWHFGWFTLSAFMQSGRSLDAFFFSFSLLSNLELQFEFRGIAAAPHTRSTLSPSIMPISPPTLYLNVLGAPMVGPAGPAWGSECGECECRRTRHCSERGGAAQRSGLGRATDDDRVISVVVPCRLCHNQEEGGRLPGRPLVGSDEPSEM